MRNSILSAAMLFWTLAAHAASTQAPLTVNVVPPAVARFIYPIITGFKPSTISVPIPGATGTVVTTASVVNSDGSAFAGKLAISGDSLFAVDGMNVVLARATTSADLDTPHNVNVTAIEPQAVQPQVSVALTPSAGSVTCDIGPPATIPAEAKAAGFTHCAANWDFSQPLYAQRYNWMNCYYHTDFEQQYPRILWFRWGLFSQSLRRDKPNI